MSMQFRAGVVGERVAVAGVFPAVAGDLVGAADAAGGEHDGLGAKQLERPALALVAERAGDAVAVLEQADDRALHVHVDAPGGCRDPAACESSRGRCGRRRAPGADSDGRRSCAAGSCRPSCDRRRAPQASSSRTRSGASFACSSAMRQLFTYWPPRIVSEKWTFQLSRSSTLAERRGDAAFGHDRVRLAEQRLADEADRHAGGRGLDGRPQARAAGADDEDVVFVCLVFRHLEDPQVRPHAHRAEPDVQVTEADREQAAPGPQHVPPIEAAHARVRGEPQRRLRQRSTQPPTT